MESVRLFIWTICLIFCAIHLTFIFVVIQQGHLRSKLKFEDPEFIELPEVYICFSIMEILNRTHLEMNYPNITAYEQGEEQKDDLGSEENDSQVNNEGGSRQSSDRSILKIVAMMKVGELFSTIKDPQNLIIDFEPAPSTDEFHKIQITANNCDQSYIFLGTLFCISIRCTLDNENPIFYNRTVLLNGESNGEMLSIRLSPEIENYSNSLSLYLISNDSTWESGGYGVHQDINRNLGEFHPFIMQLSYKVIRNIYKTNFFFNGCKNYREDGFRCRADKVTRCLNENSYRKIGAAYSTQAQKIEYDVMEMRTGLYQIFLEDSENLSSENDAHNDTTQISNEYRTLFRKLRDECKQKLPDCQKTILHPHIEGVIDFSSPQSENSVIILRGPNNMDYINTSTPVYGWENILVYVQSALGIWIAFSPNRIVEWFLKVLKSSKKHRQREHLRGRCIKSMENRKIHRYRLVFI